MTTARNLEPPDAEPASRPGREEVLEFLTPDGLTVPWQVSTLSGMQAQDDSPIVERIVVPRASKEQFALRTPRSYRADAQSERLLDREIAAGRRVSRRFPDRHPLEITQFLGHGTREGVPFTLRKAPRGEPVGRLAGKLVIEELQTFTISLFRAVAVLAGCGVVHRALGPETVWWDQEHVSITGFDHAALIGEYRMPVGRRPYASPEQERGEGIVAAEDDVWSAVVLVFYMSSRKLPGGREFPATPSGAGRLLEDELGAGFEPVAARRPAPADVLQRLTGERRGQIAPPDRRMIEGLREFDRRFPMLMSDPVPTIARGSASAAPPSPPPPSRKGWFRR